MAPCDSTKSSSNTPSPATASPPVPLSCNTRPDTLPKDTVAPPPASPAFSEKCTVLPTFSTAPPVFSVSDTGRAVVSTVNEKETSPVLPASSAACTSTVWGPSAKGAAGVKLYPSPPVGMGAAWGVLSSHNWGPAGEIPTPPSLATNDITGED